MVASLLFSVVAVGQAPKAGRNARKPGAAKPWAPPLTPDGQPDLQGVWLSNIATPLERPQELAGKRFLTDEEVAELKRRAARLFQGGQSDFAGGDNFFLALLANPDRYRNPNATESAVDMPEREFDNRTSLIVDPPDGKIPWTPDGLRRQMAAVAARLASAAASPRDLPNDMRCLTYGVPRLGGLYGAGAFGYYQIFQAPGYVVLMMEYLHEARMIPLDGRPHLPASMRLLNGDSRGSWQGHSLVVDTTNFSPQSFFLGSSANLHLVERFTRVAPDRIRYEMTFSDPDTWTMPWQAELPLRLRQDPIYEVACHEGNSEVMRDVLSGSRGPGYPAPGGADKVK